MRKANLGIQIGGTLTGGNLVNAQIYGQVPTDLQFYAAAKGSTGTGQDTKASYIVGVYFYYNVVFGAVANILGVANWASGDRKAYDPQPRYTIFEKTDSFAGSLSSARSVGESLDLRYPRRALFDALHIASGGSNDHNAPESVDLSHNYRNHNGSWTMSTDALLGKRAASPSSDGDTAMPDFSAAQQLTCPPGDSAQITIPDFRRKLYPGEVSSINADDGEQ